MSTKVLMFGWEFPPHNSGGLGVACQGIAEALAIKDLELKFVLPSPLKIDHDKIEFLHPNPKVTKRFEMEYINSPLNPYSSAVYVKRNEIIIPEDNPKIDLIGEVLKYEKAAEDIVKNTKFDIIHAHDWLSFGAGIVAKRISGKPFIAHIHATEIDRSGNSPHPYIFQKEKEGFEAADIIIAVSDFTKQIIVNNYGIDPSKIRVVHNGIDVASSVSKSRVETALDSFRKNGKKIVLFLGRLTLQKNPDGFLHAAKKALEYFPDVVFIFAGTGDMQYQLIEKTVEYGLSDSVFFPDFVRGEEKFSLYKAADLFVMPSIAEPFGLVALESLLNQTPILISKQSGVSETVQHALKVDFWDTDEIANKIVTVLKYTSLRQTLVEHGHKEAKEVTWDKAADKIIEVYREALE